MRLLIQRALEPVPYLGAYVRIAPPGAGPARVRVVLASGMPSDREADALARLLALVLALGDSRGVAPVRQLWLDGQMRLTGKLDHEIAPSQAERVERLARRVQEEWSRFVANAIARLAGEARGDAHFRFPGEAFSPERPAVQVTRWPPLPGEALPELE